MRAWSIALLAAALPAQADGGHDVAAAVAALRQGGSTGEAAAARIRHEWAEAPAGLIDGIADAPPAKLLLLREFAVAPRPAWQRWAVAEAALLTNPPGLRALALAAADLRPDRQQARLLVESALDEEVDEGFRSAIWLLDAAVADSLLGRLHALLLQPDADLGRLLPFFDHLSPQGLERLVGLVATLAPDQQRTLVRYFVQNDVQAYRERTAAALDGQVPLDAIWLARAELALTTRPRIDRLLAVLRDDKAAPELAEAAFRALIAAHVFEAPVFDWVDGSDDRRRCVRLLLDAGAETLPADRLRRWLRDDTSIAGLAAAAVGRRPALEPELEQALGEALRGVVVQGPAMPFAMALVQRGGAAAVQAAWPGLRGSPCFPDLVDALARRRVPWGHELLLAELTAATPANLDEALRAEHLDAVRLALVGLGDRRELERLVARAGAEKAVFVRRCQHYATDLPAALANRLLDAAAGADEDLAAALIGWAATAKDAEVAARLLAIWREGEVGERQLAAVNGLAATPAGAELRAELAAAIGKGGLDERREALAYELMSALPDPLGPTDLDLLARLALVAPLAEPAAERARAERWPEGTAGFPLVAAIAQRLRTADTAAVRAVFAGVAAEVAGRDDRAALSRQRVLLLWRSLVPAPDVQQAVGEATAALLLALPGADGLGDGPAHRFAARAAERADRFEAAADHARLAVHALLGDPAMRASARVFLGDRDPVGGSDPWAALAASPHLFAARAALAAGDPAAARQALALAREFAGRDADTRIVIDTLKKDPRL